MSAPDTDAPLARGDDALLAVRVLGTRASERAAVLVALSSGHELLVPRAALTRAFYVEEPAAPEADRGEPERAALARSHAELCQSARALLEALRGRRVRGTDSARLALELALGEADDDAGAWPRGSR